MRGNRLAVALALVAGVLVGLFGGLKPPADAARNASGTHSLPTGNPVVTGTAITSTWANNTLTDISSELTNSLDRNGRGAMLAPLQLSSGSVGAPGLTFSSDTNTGIYRNGADDMRLACGGNDLLQCTSTTITLPRGLTVTMANAGTAITATGNDNGYGISATGGSTSGTGGVFAGAGVGGGINATGGSTAGTGVVANGGASGGTGLIANGGTVSGKGIQANGIGTGVGGQFTGGTGNAIGVVCAGGGTGTGGTFANGTAATGGTRRDAVSLLNGDLDMSGVADPASTTVIADRLTPMNIPKAWAFIDIAGSGTQTVSAGFNIASLACASSSIQVTFASPFASANYAVVVSGSNNNRTISVNRNSASRVDLQFRDNTTNATVDPCGVFTQELFLVAYGAQ
jgi:hypothetical protein